ncbi:16S rRNA (uracil(1498)-N(3))-methyltransferase [Microbulbifer sp. OS29]|uniref:Ribosomal RNA small subunit methyltransferase E n=1 Tax=Microbulbifer okhotskensis TaxID=2926617 RepID=A0A9X2J7G0_9GAMM|nr:16S rRNA (uracil(1498)-N(3))-methyltransferase [Microbulbifer okhotskensis]MCO1334441.1 16S rRNA (uracil(1498)-N(3))-methyltransferase [Microbulbifer okhotskensis]
MNLIVLQEHDFIGPDLVRLSGRQLEHISQVHKATIGQQLRIGMLNGKIGHGKVVSLSDSHIEIQVELLTPPPEPLPLTLILALPRPKMLKRVIQHLTSLGVKKLILLNSYRVEKSYWQTPWLKEDKLFDQCLLGLEQAVDTQMPEILLRKRFKPFVEDELPDMASQTRKLVAHPVGGEACPVNIDEPTTLAIGPEGGFIDYEVKKLQEAGFKSVHLGPRILRVETALPVLVSRLFPAT